MQRRFFLKAVAALSAAPLIKVPDFRVIEPAGIILPGETWFANIREMSAYDVLRDVMLYRWDVWNGENQWGVDFRMYPEQQGGLAKAREAARIVLADTLRNDGVDLRSLRPIPEYPEAVRFSSSQCDTGSIGQS